MLPRRLLTSWKEIARHLGVTERTAQNWEREHGLPVHRLPGEKGRVYVWEDELDHWQASVHHRRATWGKFRSRPVLVAAATLTVTALILAASLFWWLQTRRGPPARFFLDVRTLVVADDNGRVIWSRTFDEPFHRAVTPADLAAMRLASFADLDGDGRNEFLFVYRPVSESTRGATLFCFSDRGQILWQYTARHPVSTPKETFDPPYLASFVLPLPPARDGTRSVVFVGHHLRYFPAHVTLLSPRGHVQGQYWHSGHLLHGETAWLDGCEGPSLLLAGVSNSYKTSTLIALDPGNLQCASDESEHPVYQLNRPGRNCELARILFPRTCISRKFDPYSQPSGLYVFPDHIQFGTLERFGRKDCCTQYLFDNSLSLRSAEVIDSFLAYHRELEAAAQLDHPFSESEERALSRIRILRHWKLSPSPQGQVAATH
ncbi:MAG: helix-turn-helix domain-containing protein [Bryobacteraceae bacterium]